MDELEWARRGLLDPTSESAPARAALLTWLAATGVSTDEMVEAESRGRLFGVAGDRHLRPVRPTLSLDAAAAVSGLDPQLLRRLWREAGFADVAPDEQVLSVTEAEAFSVVSTAASLLGERAVERLLSVVGTSMRRIAESVITICIDEVEDMLLDRSADELATAQVYEAATSMVPAFHALLGVLHGLHHEATNRHVEMGLLLGSAGQGSTVHVAVGFADISGWTPLALRLDRAELADLVHAFGTWASSVVTTAGSRVVQTLGDAVMFVGAPDEVCRAAQLLIDGPGELLSLPPLRAGAALGEVVLHGGDYYGPIVNLAARLTTDASPGELLVDPVLAGALDPEAWTTAAGAPRQLKGIGLPVVVWSVRPRLAGSGP